MQAGGDVIAYLIAFSGKYVAWQLVVSFENYFEFLTGFILKVTLFDWSYNVAAFLLRRLACDMSVGQHVMYASYLMLYRENQQTLYENHQAVTHNVHITLMNRYPCTLLFDTKSIVHGQSAT